MYPGWVTDAINEFYRYYGDMVQDPEFWIWLRDYLVQNRPLGEIKYQTKYIQDAYDIWRNSKIQEIETTPKTINQIGVGATGETLPTTTGGYEPMTWTDPETGIKFYTDETGTWKPYYFPEEKQGMSEADRLNYELALRKFQADQMSNASTMEYNQQELALRRQQQLAQEENNRRVLEEQRAQRLAEYRASPGDWIKAWEYEHMPRNYTQTIPMPDISGIQKGAANTLNNWVNQFETEVGRTGVNPQGMGLEVLRGIYQKDVQSGRALSGMGGGGTTEGLAQNLATIEGALIAGAAIAQNPGLLNRVYTAGEESTPLAPQGMGWVSQLVPGWETGKPIPTSSARLPSAQLWNKIPWSQREMFGGYLGSQYQKGIPSLEDLENLIAERLPRRTTRASSKAAMQV
jgi:hypothetical protein